MSEPRLDLTALPENEHEESLAFAWAALESGSSFLLVASAPPLALLHKFFHTREGAYEWHRVFRDASRCIVALRRLGPDPLLRRAVPRSPALASVVRLAPQPNRAAARLLEAIENARQGAVVHASVRGEPDTVLQGLRGRGLDHFCEYAGDGAWVVSVRRAAADPAGRSRGKRESRAVGSAG